MESPICLVEHTAKGKFEVNPEALNILSKIQQPVVVVAIVGSYGTGKSYLMNKLAGTQRGFKLGSPIQSMTKGIWMWCVPHPIKEKQTLILLDTEGLGDVEKRDYQHNIRIFTLAVLLSSTLVYNSKVSCDPHALDKLKFLAGISEMIKDRELSKHFPDFFWAVRDCDVELKVEGRSVSEGEYLNSVLSPTEPERTPEDVEYNNLRKRLWKNFKSWKCFVFGLPAANVEHLHGLDETPEGKLNPTFVAQCQRFRDHVVLNAKPKLVQKKDEVSGQRLGELAKMYTESINSSNSICVEDVVMSLSEKENNMALQEATQYYEEKMKEAMLSIVTSNDLKYHNREIHDQAQQIFYRRSFMDEDQVFHEQFLTNTYKLRDEFFTNLKKTLDEREAPPKKHGKKLKKGLDEDEYLTPRQTTYKTDLKEEEEKYIWKDEESVTNETEGHVRELSYHSLPPYDASHIRKQPNKVKKQEPSRPAPPPPPPPYPHKSNFTAPEASPSPKSPETYGRQKPSPSVLQRLPDWGGSASEPRRSHGTRPPPVPRKPTHGTRLEGPICLIENKEGEKFSVNPEAVNILSMISQPVVVVAIVGMYRTGKSYLMNKLAGAQKGFSLGSTIEAQTKGIWMWCVPHPTKSNHTLVLLDTEGLGDTGKVDTRNDAWIFTLTVLLSSALVYNSKETIDLNALNKLKFVGELAELIKVRSEDKQDNDKDFSRHFPIFIWAVRDFLLELKIEGQLISEDEYLQNALQLKDSGNTSKDAEFNNVRKSIRMFFGNRKCFVFDLPTTNGEHLQRLDEVSEDQLNARFMSQCQTFCDYIFRNAEVKRVQDTVMITGQRLAELAEIYTHAINFSKVACMEEAVLSLSDKENKMAVQEATQYYKKRMDDVPLPTETLDDFLDLSRQHEDAARDIFMRRSFKDKDECFLKEFMGNIQKKKNELYFRNKDKSQQRCRDIIQKYSVDFDKALAEGFYFIPGGHARFKDDLKAIEDRYNKECGSRVKAEEVLQEYLKSKQAIGDTILEADTTLQQIEKEEEVRCQRQKSNERRVKQRQLEDAQEKQKLEEDKAFYMKTYKQLMERMEADRKAMSEKFERVIAEKEREMNISLQQGERGYAMMCQKQIQDLQKEKQLNLSLQKDLYDKPRDSDVMLDAMTGSLF